MNQAMTPVIVSGAFDNLRSRQVRFLEEAHRLGLIHLLLWSDSLIETIIGQPPKFPLEERSYLLQSIRYVDDIQAIDSLPDPDQIPEQILTKLSSNLGRMTWVVNEDQDNPLKRAFCAANGINYRILQDSDLAGFPARRYDALEAPSSRRKVIVTGCYDWFHSGHVRFFEEAAELGDLFVVVGSDANVRLLKGDGHPLFCEDERRYMVQAVRFVKAALVSSGTGWMDAEPQIEQIRPDIYAVNEDGDKPEKRQYCAEHGLEYAVLKRQPRPGLPRRESTILRGF